MQSCVTLLVDRPLVRVILICSFTIILMLSNHIAILDTHTNFPLVMSITVNKQRIFLLVSTSFQQQKLKSSTENCPHLLIVTNSTVALH